jgi:cell division protein FtsW (lipid II flippase)
MIATRLRQVSLLVFAMLLSFIAFFQMFERTSGTFPAKFAGTLGVVGVLFLTLWGLLLKFQPYASQSILPCVLLLTSIGTMMIARIDDANGTDVAFRQLIWLCVALVLTMLLVVFLQDYRVLRRFLICQHGRRSWRLLLSPMLPGIGRRNRRRAHLARFRQPYLPAWREFAKALPGLLLRRLSLRSPRPACRGRQEDAGHATAAHQGHRARSSSSGWRRWACLVIQHDLGTSLMFFAMFVSMLYVATGRKSWVAIGFLAFAAGSFVASRLFAHVGYRVQAWLHPLDPAVYNQYPGGSSQLVKGLFGMASGGLLGTGIGQGHPSLTPLANSDFIYSSLGEELGLTGLLAILVLYVLIIASGLSTAMRIKDGFGKLLASGLVFTMAFQVFTVVGGITLVIPLTGLTLPYMAAGGSSLIANFVLAGLLIVISNAANKPEPDTVSDTFRYEALAALREHELRRRRAEAGTWAKARAGTCAAPPPQRQARLGRRKGKGATA